MAIKEVKALKEAPAKKTCTPVSASFELTTGVKEFVVGADKLKTPTIPSGYKFVGRLVLTGYLVKK